MENFSLEGSQIRLRQLTLSDLERYRFWQQPQHLWHSFDGPYYSKPSKEAIDKQVESLKLRIETDNWPIKPVRLIIANKASDELVGIVTRYWISKETNWCALGIAIFDPEHWGHGVGSEALSLWIDHLFEIHPDWVRLDLRTWSGNERMIQLAQKLGFQEEARFRKARIVNGSYYDGLGYGILREEWMAHKSHLTGEI